MTKSELDYNQYIYLKNIKFSLIKIKNDVVLYICSHNVWGKNVNSHLNVYLCAILLLSIEKYQVQYILDYKQIT